MDIGAWDARLQQTFYPVLYEEVPSLRNVSAFFRSLSRLQGATAASLTPDETRRMTAVQASDWNVASIAAISTILWHMSGLHLNFPRPPPPFLSSPSYLFHLWISLATFNSAIA